MAELELEQYAACADLDHGADLEQLEPDGIDLRLGPFGALEGKPQQRLDQRVGQRRQIQRSRLPFISSVERR
jgi:hypothetical protein